MKKLRFFVTMQCVETEGLQKVLDVSWIYQKQLLTEMIVAKSVLSEEINNYLFMTLGLYDKLAE